jgi:LysM repeat protein
MTPFLKNCVAGLMSCCLLALGAERSLAYTFSTTALRDSIGVEIEGGKEVIIHRLKAKETYFGLSRMYQIAVQDLISANQNKALKIGDTVRIPTGREAKQQVQTPVTPTTTPTPAQPENLGPEVVLKAGEFTEYKVGKGETLFTIAKRFMIDVPSLQRTNVLENNILKEGMILKVPHKIIPAPVVEPEIEEEIDVLIALEESEEAAEIRKNRYGLREITEKGLGIWLEDLTTDGGTMLALHKTAAVGTIIKITNPMTNHSTFAKVVGKFAENQETQNAIIVVSKSVVNAIGILDKRFQIEITYGAPTNE